MGSGLRVESKGRSAVTTPCSKRSSVSRSALVAGLTMIWGMDKDKAIRGIGKGAGGAGARVVCESV